MTKPLTHPLTKQQLQNYVARPAQALGLFGPAGLGVNNLALWLGAELLGVTQTQLQEHPYAMHIAPEDGKAISIEAVRAVERFLQLKVPSNKAVNRVIIIQDGQLLGIEAQNALLKTLEEPPQSTVLVIAASRQDALLPTIQSRLQTLTAKTPIKIDVINHFEQVGHDKPAIERVYAMTGGLPELMAALLQGNDHPLLAATTMARQLVGGTAYERLTLVDQLSKQKNLALDTLFILQQMAHVRLQTAAGDSAKQWQRLLKASYQAAEALSNSGQPKLVLTNLMLHM